MLTECKRNGRRFDLSVLSDDQLALFQRAADNGAEIDGTTYLSVVDFSDQELAELEKALWLAGVLKKGGRFK
jgi:hypothetical protein